MTDTIWLEANLDPAAHRTPELRIPDLPPDDVQRRFTGKCGRLNLQQAFEFYSFVLPRLPEPKGRYRVIDFGGGWGRILRFFVKDIPPDKLLLTDTMAGAVQLARDMKPPFRVLHHDPQPPFPLEPGATADAVIAFSVFSHLNESTARAWLAYFASILAPGGRVIATTRGRRHIQSLRREAVRMRGLRQRLKRALRGKRALDQGSALAAGLPEPGAIEARLSEGGFQFYPFAGGDELSASFYGEAWITEGWLRDNASGLGYETVEFVEEFGAVNQCVFVLTKGQ